MFTVVVLFVDPPAPPGPAVPPVPALPRAPAAPALPALPGLPGFPASPLAPPVPPLPLFPGFPGLPELPGAPLPAIDTDCTPNGDVKVPLELKVADPAGTMVLRRRLETAMGMVYPSKLASAAQSIALIASTP